MECGGLAAAFKQPASTPAPPTCTHIPSADRSLSSARKVLIPNRLQPPEEKRLGLKHIGFKRAHSSSVFRLTYLSYPVIIRISRKHAQSDSHLSLFLCALCFHTLTNPCSRKPFVLTSIQIAPGGVGVPRHIRATLCFPHHMRHVAPLSPVASVDSAYFLSPRGCAYPNRCTFKSSRTRSSETRHILHNLGQCKQSRINTCKSVSKQMTLTPFRINTYRKRGGGGVGKIRAFTLPAAASPAAQNLCPGSARTRTPPRSWSPDGLAPRSAAP